MGVGMLEAGRADSYADVLVVVVGVAVAVAGVYVEGGTLFVRGVIAVALAGLMGLSV